MNFTHLAFLASAVLLSRAPLAIGASGEHDWTWWATQWLSADSLLASRGNEPEAVAEALVRRNEAEEALRSKRIREHDIVSLLGDPTNNRLALAAVIVNGSAGDLAFRAMLDHVSLDDVITRRYVFIAVTGMTTAQLGRFRSRIVELLKQETSPVVLIGGLTILRRLDPYEHADVFARYFDHDDPSVARYAFAVLAASGDGALSKTALRLRRSGRKEALTRLCAHVTPEYRGTAGICGSKDVQR